MTGDPGSNALPDPVELARALIRCASVTPEDAGALGVIEEALEPVGFRAERMHFEADGTPPVDNLWIRFGEGEPLFCFAGHTDVVPPGDPAQWSSGPFDAVTRDGRLIGRGAVDMKGAIAAFAAAAAGFAAERKKGFGGSVALLITGDEEGPAINGTRKMLETLQGRHEAIHACIVGEPTNPNELGEVVKIGRRGSLNGIIRVEGVQGHVAYPARADNPVHPLIAMLAAITAEPLDEGSDHFEATSLQVTTVDVGNPTTNLIPAAATARFNVRFNDLHDSAGVERWVRERLDRVGRDYTLDIVVSGESFLTPPGALSGIVVEAVEQETGRRPTLDTGGGTSDARFIKDHAPVVEFGLVSAMAHKVDEATTEEEIRALTRIYGSILDRFFGGV